MHTLTYMYIYIYIERERETDRKTDWDRQTETETNREFERREIDLILNRIKREIYIGTYIDWHIDEEKMIDR